MVDTRRQPFLTHLRELRVRLLWCLLALLVGTAIGYRLNSWLLSLLIRPLNQQLYFSSPAGGLEFVLQICLAFGIVCATPVTLYHVLRFVEPAFARWTTRFVASVLAASVLLLLIGVSFAYVVSLPVALYFLATFNVEHVTALITTTEYLRFASRYILGFGLLFQLPLVLLLINRLSPLSARKLQSRHRWVILVSFMAAAILTPTFDILNQALFAIPIILLYEVSILAIWVRNRKLRPKGV